MNSVHLFEKEKIGVAMFKLASPSVLVSVITLVYQLINSFFIGRLNNTAMLASISLSSTLTLLVSKVGESVGIGASSYLGRELGAKKSDEIRKIVQTSISFNLLLSITLAIVSLLLLKPYIIWQTDDQQVIQYAYSYGIISIISSIFVSLYTSCVHLFRSVGDVQFPMYIMGLSVAINILLDPILMFDFGLGLGVSGAAIASAIAQIVSCVLCLKRITSSKTVIQWSLFDFNVDWKIVRKIVSVGSAVYVRNLMSTLSIAVFNKTIFIYGTDFAAGCNVGKFAMYFVNFFIQGVSNGYLPLASYTYGAKNYKRLFDSITWNLNVLTGYCIVAIIFIHFCADQFVSLFTTGELAINYGARYLRAYNLSLPVYSVYYILTITLQATGRGKESMVLSMFRQGVIYIPSLILMSSLFNQSGVLYAQPLADWITVLTAIIISRKLIVEIVNGKKVQQRYN